MGVEVLGVRSNVVSIAHSFSSLLFLAGLPSLAAARRADTHTAMLHKTKRQLPAVPAASAQSAVRVASPVPPSLPPPLQSAPDDNIAVDWHTEDEGEEKQEEQQDGRALSPSPATATAAPSLPRIDVATTPAAKNVIRFRVSKVSKTGRSHSLTHSRIQSFMHACMHACVIERA